MLSRDLENTAEWVTRILPGTLARAQIIAILNDLAADAHALEQLVRPAVDRDDVALVALRQADRA